MNGVPVEEWDRGRISGPLSKKEFLAYLRKIGKLPPASAAEAKPTA